MLKLIAKLTNQGIQDEDHHHYPHPLYLGDIQDKIIVPPKTHIQIEASNEDLTTNSLPHYTNFAKTTGTRDKTKEIQNSQNIYSKPIQVENTIVLPSFSNEVKHEENIRNHPIQIISEYSEYLPEYNIYSEPVDIFNLHTSDANNIHEDYQEYADDEQDILAAYMTEYGDEYEDDILPTYTHDNTYIPDYHEYEHDVLPSYISKHKDDQEEYPEYEHENYHDVLPN